MHKSNEVLDKISAALDIFLNFEEIWRQVCQDMRLADLETTDILHEIEEKKVKDKVQTIDDLEVLRVSRRCAKEDQEVLLHLREFVSKRADIIEEIQLLVSSMKKEAIKRESRTYTPRIRKNVSNF